MINRAENTPATVAWDNDKVYKFAKGRGIGTTNQGKTHLKGKFNSE